MLFYLIEVRGQRGLVCRHGKRGLRLTPKAAAGRQSRWTANPSRVAQEDFWRLFKSRPFQLLSDDLYGR
jgi:hypothetical protein